MTQTAYGWETRRLAKLSPRPLAGQLSLVTGAAQGIGLEIAKELASQGSNVCLLDVSDAAAAVEQVKAAGGPGAKVVAHALDIRDREIVREAIRETVQQFGRLDIVVNNAGTCSRKSLEHMDDSDWNRDIDINLYGTFLVTQAAIYPHMVEHGSGRIINVSSVSGINGGTAASGPSQGRSGPAYAASKGGVIGFTKWVAKEVGHLGITCNSVAPGPVSTEMTTGLEYDLGGQALNRMGQPQDIASAVAYLASPQAGFITGQTLNVCGGLAIG